jgi:hypothetical protein
MVQIPIGSVHQGQGSLCSEIFAPYIYGKCAVDFSDVWFAFRSVKDGQRQGAWVRVKPRDGRICSAVMSDYIRQGVTLGTRWQHELGYFKVRALSMSQMCIGADKKAKKKMANISFTSTLQEVRAWCRKLSQMEPGSTILNLNPSSSQWNGATRNAWETEEVQGCAISRMKNCNRF